MGILSWLFGNAQNRAAPADAESRRYEGRPLLIVMENYVLDCIGELAPDKQEGIRKIVQTVWSGGMDWKKTVREQLHLDDRLDDELRRMWEKNKQIANENSATLQPVEFARMVVDQNLSERI